MAAEIADEMAVMYAGRIVEQGPVESVFHRPAHPYTAGLLACLPTLLRGPGRLAAIPGVVPPLAARPTGCGFAPRCGRAATICRASQPPERPRYGGGTVACHFADSGAA